jgi:hypothetical protein
MSNFQPDINDLFKTGRIITNGTKHFLSKRDTKRQKRNTKRPKIDTKRQAGFSSAFSDGFARPLIIVRDEGSEISADKLLREMIKHWEGEKAAGKLVEIFP